MLYESYSQPVHHPLHTALGWVGALLALLATDMEFSLIAFLGILAVDWHREENAIMMVDFALRGRTHAGAGTARCDRTSLLVAISADHG